MQVFMVFWSVLKSPLVLGSRFVATSQLFALRVDWLISPWYGFSPGEDFPTDSSTSSNS